MGYITFTEIQQEILATRMAFVLIRELKKEGLITNQELKKVETEAAKLVPVLFDDDGKRKV